MKEIDERWWNKVGRGNDVMANFITGEDGIAKKTGRRKRTMCIPDPNSFTTTPRPSLGSAQKPHRKPKGPILCLSPRKINNLLTSEYLYE